MHRGECAATGGLYRPTRLCAAHLNCTKKSYFFFVFFFGVVRLEGVWWGGSMFQEVGVCMGFQRGGEVI